MKLRDANLQVYEKNSFAYPLSRILLSFSQKAWWLLLLKRLSKCASTFLSGNISGKYLFNQHWSESTCWIWHLKFSWVQFLSNTLFFCRLKLYTQAEIALKKDMWSIIRASDLLGPLSNNLKHEHLKVH